MTQSQHTRDREREWIVTNIKACLSFSLSLRIFSLHALVAEALQDLDLTLLYHHSKKVL